LPFNMVNAHLSKTDDSCILVDTGIPGLERKDFGVDGIVHHTAGHTPGSQTVAREPERLVNSGAKRFHMGHGGTLEAPEVLRHAKVPVKLDPAHCVCGQHAPAASAT
jgi:hypothetical protein